MTRLKQMILLGLVLELQTCSVGFAQDRLRTDPLITQVMLENNKYDTRVVALKHIDEGLKKESGNASYWFVKGLVLGKMEEAEEALQCFNKALALQPKLTQALSAKAASLNAMKRHAEALTAINEAISKGADNSSYAIKADILDHLDRGEEAEKIYDKLVELAPTNMVTLGKRAAMAARAHHREKAIADYTVLIANDTDHPANWKHDLQHRAQLYIETRKYALAIADYKSALKHFPDARDLHDALLKAYTLTGDTAAAQKESRALQGLDQDFQPFK